MGIPMSFILGLNLRIFQFFYFLFFLSKLSSFIDYFLSFFSILSFFNKKTSVALVGYGFAWFFAVCPRPITCGLLGNGCLNSIKNYSQFSVFGGES